MSARGCGRPLVGERAIYQGVHTAHEGVADAIVAGDVALAWHRMRAHLDAMREFLAS